MSFFYSQLFVTPKYPTDSFAGQIVIVTGANTGLGLEAARHITRLNADRVILAVRNTVAGERAKQAIHDSTGRSNVCEVWELDLASYASVQAFAKRALSDLPRIDVLLENAGIAAGTYSLAESHERTMTVNVISTFLLGLLLFPKLEKTAKENPATKPRWVVVSSEVHASTKLPQWKTPNTFETLDDEKEFNPATTYPISKLLEVLIVREIAPKLAGSQVILNMVNPGLCHSELARDAGWGMWFLKLILARNTEVGSRTLVAAAAAGEESHGSYMTDGKVDDSKLAPWVTSEEGKKAQAKVWLELKQILEEIVPGVTKSF